MRVTFSILFYLKKTKSHVDGPVPIYMRITVDGQRAELSINRECDPADWSVGASRARGNKEKVRSLNAYIDDWLASVYDAEKELLLAGSPITASTLKRKLIGEVEKPLLLIDIFKEHNRKVKALVGNEFAAGTLTRYETSLKHTQNFIRWYYKVEDIDIKKVNHDFISNYEFYLRTERKCENNSAIKYIKNFKKIIRICQFNGWLEKDPFLNYKLKVRPVERTFLNNEELMLITNKKLVADRLNQVRDIFLFSCYTGLAYSDIKKLKKSEINKGANNEMWMSTVRTKTSIPVKVPLLPPALKLIDKYKDHPVSSNSGLAFPVLTNQKMNSYLKEISDACGIIKELTYHIARHTFATTVTLANGVPIESVSKMLGHTNIKMTQHYAKILDTTVGDHMILLKEKLKDPKKLKQFKPVKEHI